MKEIFGFAGKTLHVDLSTGKITSNLLEKEQAERFIGGMGLGGWLAYNLINAETDPLSPENALIFSVSPLAGTIAPASSRVHINSRSPNSNLLCYTNTGHSMGLMMKHAGYDALVITGRADNPVYLRISDDDTLLCDAGNLWGRDSWDTIDRLREELDGYWIDCIGPSAENAVKYSTIICSKHSNFNKTGAGTIMGSKNLKAIAARGSKDIRVADPEKFMKLTDEFTRKILKDPELQEYRSFGAPLRGRPGFTPEEFITRIAERPYACPSCPVACKHLINLRDGKYKGLRHRVSHMVALAGHNQLGGPENWDELAKIVEMENRYGLEASVIAGLLDYLVICYEQGILSEKEIGFLPKRGSESLLRLISMTAIKEGIGAFAAEGMLGVVKKLGKDTEKYIKHSKWTGRQHGLEKEVSTFTIGSLTNPRGAKGEFVHIPIRSGNSKNLSINEVTNFCKDLKLQKETMNRLFIGSEDVNVGRLVKWVEDYSFAYICMGFCSREIVQRHINLEKLSQLYEATTGIEIGPSKLLAAGERVFNLFKAFNIKMGSTRSDDLPSRGATLNPNKPLSIAGKEYGSLNHILNEYYDEREWNVDGVPSKDKLIDLGLQDIAKDIG